MTAMRLGVALSCLLTGCFSRPSLATDDASIDGSNGSDAPLADAPPTCEPPGAVMHVRFDEGSGATSTDPITGLVGQLSGASWRGGRLGGAALEIGGNGDTPMSFGSHAPINELGPITVCAWVMADAEPGINMNVVDKTTNGSVGGWALFVQRSDTGVAVRAGVMGSSGAYKYGLTDASLGAWHHICGTWNGSQGVGALKVYLNGDEDLLGSADQPGGGPYNDTANPLRIGGNPADGSFTLDGAVDDFILYERVLGEDEIATLFACDT
jgi:hypothetical protein